MHKTKIKTYVHGKFPRSAELVEISRDVDRKRRKLSELEKQYKKDLTAFLQAQKKANLDLITDGALPWQDIFRPFIETSTGFITGPLTRWFDNNCFFRQPIITGKITANTKKLDKFFNKITPKVKWHITLPSPFIFAKLADDTTTNNFSETLEKITNLLIDIIKDLDKKGAAIIQLNEPYIPYHGSTKEEADLFLKSLLKIKNTIKDSAQLGVNFYFGDAAPIVKALANKDLVDIVGIDFYKTNLADIPERFNYDIVAGVFDGRNSLLEKKSSLKKFIKQVIKKLHPQTIYISNNSDFELLPEPVAKEKIRILGEFRNSFSS